VNAVVRTRLFLQLEDSLSKGVDWVVAPAGSEKNTLVAEYLQGRALSALWYNCDEGDAAPASFFYYMREAVRRVLGSGQSSCRCSGPSVLPILIYFPEDFLRA
jgi:ATP/maltotriose-dependent transcriptional regulator MalT